MSDVYNLFNIKLEFIENIIEVFISWYDNVEVEYNIVYRDVIWEDEEDNDENVLFIFGNDVKSVILGYNNGVDVVFGVIIHISSYGWE